MGTGVGVEEGVSVSPAARAKALLCKTVCPPHYHCHLFPGLLGSGLNRFTGFPV